MIYLAPANQIGRWAAPFNLPPLAIHQVMLPTGKVLMFAYPDSTYTQQRGDGLALGPGHRVDQGGDPPNNPATGALQHLVLGMTLLPDGRVVVAGGNLQYCRVADLRRLEGPQRDPDLQPVHRDLDASSPTCATGAGTRR